MNLATAARGIPRTTTIPAIPTGTPASAARAHAGQKARQKLKEADLALIARLGGKGER